MLQLSVIYRLPQYYHWSGKAVEPQTTRGRPNEKDLIGMALLSRHAEGAQAVMDLIKATLAERQIECLVLEWQGEPCLFLACQDECVAACCLKNKGVAIAEQFCFTPSA